MRINHNIAALNTYSRLNSASQAQSQSLEKLSSGQRINKAGDDAAGLAISEKMRAQIRGTDSTSFSKEGLALAYQSNATQSTAAVQQGQNAGDSSSNSETVTLESIIKEGQSKIKNAFSTGDSDKIKSEFDDLFKNIKDYFAKQHPSNVTNPVQDVDPAKKTIESSKNNIINQAPMAMLAQANATPGAVLNLLA